MNKEFIPYEQALELKKLGFDEECLMVYYGTNRPDKKDKRYLPAAFGKIRNSDLITDEVAGIWLEGQITAPLYQQAFRWFREKYKLSGTPQYFTGGYYCYTINDMKDTKESNRLFTEFETYEEAELECLKKLIEIVKNGKSLEHSHEYSIKEQSVDKKSHT